MGQIVPIVARAIIRTQWGGGGGGGCDCHPHPHTPRPWDQKSEQGNGGYWIPLSPSTIWGNHPPFNHTVSEGALLNIQKFLKNSNKIQSVSKTIQHTPKIWYIYLQSFEKLQQCVFELVRKLNVTDGQTEGGVGGGAFQYLPSRAFGVAGGR